VLPDVVGMPAPGISFKEGLALTNGATFCTAVLALAIADASELAALADLTASLSLEAVCGRTRALDPRVHAARGMAGQIQSAATMRAVLSKAEDQTTQSDRADEIQDVYSIRCTPQVNGAARDAIRYARQIAEQEMNAATDNPLFFPDGADDASPPWDVEMFASNRDLDYGDASAFSAGNFHGEPVGLAADFLAIAVAELAGISERRLQVLLDGHHNRGLPKNLASQPGLHSGFMVAQYCAAGLVSENKVLAHPASVDSIPTSANTEDHVAMASVAALKLRTVLANAQAVLAIELMAAAQAVEWRIAMDIDPNSVVRTPMSRRRDPLEQRAERLEDLSTTREVFMAATDPGHRAAIASQLGRGTAAAYLAIRSAVATLHDDRVLDGDIRAIRRLIETGSLLAAVQKTLPDGAIPTLDDAPDAVF
jgi:histidine ammonia-lyase